MTITTKINLDLIPLENPAPGTYRAVLINTQRREKAPGRFTIRCEWGLISLPARDGYYVANSFYGITSPGLLAKTLWSWKKLLWEEAVKSEAEGGGPIPERFIGDEADVVVGTWERNDGSARPVVESVHPPGSRVKELEDGSYITLE